MLNMMSEAQRSMLRVAATRDDLLLTPPTNARTVAVKSVASKLLAAGWAKEVKARGGSPVWRKDFASGAHYALKLTAKGLKAVGAVIEVADRKAAPAEQSEETEAVAPAHAKPAAAVAGEKEPAAKIKVEQHLAVQARPPSPASKLGRVLDMLAADGGATVEELTAATGWLEHTTRAALTGLRHRGYELSLTRKERGDASVYRVLLSGGEAAQ